MRSSLDQRSTSTKENEITPHLTYGRDERKLDHINLLLLKDEESPTKFISMICPD
jgi:hypothetical protein